MLGKKDPEGPTKYRKQSKDFHVICSDYFTETSLLKFLIFSCILQVALFY